MQRIAAIGDVHGRADKLARLLDDAQLADRTVIFLGDLVNRGPDSKGVLDLVCEWVAHRGAQVLLGNHDDALLQYVKCGDFVRFALTGGLPTIRSYVGEARGDVHQQFLSAFPKAHRKALENAGLYWETPDFVLCHAGISPDAPTRRDKALLLNGVGSALFERRTLLPKLCVCGHYVQRQGTPFISDTLVCIDTGCGTADGPLTAFLLPECRVVQVE